MAIKLKALPQFPALLEAWKERRSVVVIFSPSQWRADRTSLPGQPGSARVTPEKSSFGLGGLWDRWLYGPWTPSGDLPFVAMYQSAWTLRIADGPDEVHKILIAKNMLGR